jgi:hypothetical protein
MNLTATRHALHRTVVIGLFAFLPEVLPAQSIWADRPDGRFFSIEILKPNFKHDDDPKLAKYTFFLSLHLPVSDSTRMAFELPLAYAAYRHYNYDYAIYRVTQSDKSETAIGNPYIGIETSTGGNVFLEAGFRLPLASGKKYHALSAGSSADFDRMEAFAAKLLPLQMSLNVAHRDASGLVMRLRGGPDLWINTDPKSEGDKTELWIHYSAQAGFEGKRLSVLTGVTGRLWVTEEHLSLGARSFHQIGVNAGVNLGRFRPALFARFPLDKDLSDYVQNVIGLTCSIRLE